MPPKSKAEQAAREKVAVDKTFGLKNKNKSKVVQKYIKNITQNAKGTTTREGAQKEKEKEAKAATVAKAALLNSLFNMGTDKKGRAFDPEAKKKAKQKEEEAIAAGKKLNDETRKALIEGIANSIRLTNPKGVRMSELGGTPIINALKENHADVFRTLSLLLFIKANDEVFWVNDPEDNNPTIRVQEDVDAEVAPDERPIEEIIEERRMALPPGGTPVTLETFRAWKEKKEAERREKVEAERQEAAKKKGDKGLSALSGRDLFIFDASLFVDDEGAVDAAEYDERAEDPSSDDEVPGPKAAAEPDSDEDEEGEEGAAGARGSGDPASGPFNKALFLDGGDLPDDDLDDLDDDEDEEGEVAVASKGEKKAEEPAKFSPPPRK